MLCARVYTLTHNIKIPDYKKEIGSYAENQDTQRGEETVQPY